MTFTKAIERCITMTEAMDHIDTRQEADGQWVADASIPGVCVMAVYAPTEVDAITRVLQIAGLIDVPEDAVAGS